MAKINLLPTEFIAQGPIVRLAKVLKDVSVFASVLFVLLSVSIITFVVINSSILRNSRSRQTELETAIAELKQAEQGFFLVRDRLNKVKEVLAQESMDKNLTALSSMAAIIPSSMTVSDADIAPKKCSITVSAPTSSAMAQFMSGLVTTTIFKSIYLKTFSFNQTTGYAITIEGSVSQ